MTTFQNIQLALAGSSPGRVTLHLICLCRDRKLRWHARGIGRELRSAGNRLQASLHHVQSCVGHATDLSAASQAVSAIRDTVFIRPCPAQNDTLG
jgi:hypothetical protein